jgi:2'-5' RNA ligase
VRGARHELPIEQAHYWPHNRIVWAGPRETPPALAALADDLARALGRAGFELEDRAFSAHVTLLRRARVRHALPPPPAVSWPVEAFALVRSDLSAEGASYSVLRRFALD